jgi:hypothetical protein
MESSSISSPIFATISDKPEQLSPDKADKTPTYKMTITDETGKKLTSVIVKKPEESKPESLKEKNWVHLKIQEGK